MRNPPDHEGNSPYETNTTLAEALSVSLLPRTVTIWTFGSKSQKGTEPILAGQGTGAKGLANCPLERMVNENAT